ncbi:Importin-11 [Armadillidium nasatum]|uniref:Importin-11 n=1 Tax=Armadillidium nasatum TaxID=96803 RepID=A0A5N5STB8_9CRUS|nr:Importin-11 [Armadillidium nasatum]
MNGGLEIVLQTLQQATSQIPDQFKPAESMLENWQAQPGFYSILVEIFSQHSLDANVRWLAVLYFKNGVDKYWRKSAPQAIAEEEKIRIRRGLLQNLREPLPQIAIQLAVLISKLARVDCPRDWPDLIPTLFEGIKTDDDLVRHRTLLTLHHVIKQLASKRLAGDRRTFQELTSHMLIYLLELWQNQTEVFLSPSALFPGFMSSLERSHLALKILRKLIIHGLKKPHESREGVEFLHNIFERINVMLEFRRKYESVDHVRTISAKYIILLTKVFLDLLESHPFSFIQFIKPSLEMVLHYIFTPAGEGLLFERFIVQCMNLLKGILVCAEYKPSKIIEDTVSSETLEAFKIKSDFFTNSVLVGVCNKLISHYFPLNQDDLKLWDSDPEEFCLEIEGGESWKYDLRPCAESLFVTLFHEYREVLTPAIVELTNACSALVDPLDFHAICQKDSVYKTLGLAAFDLFDDINFDNLFSNTLVKELKVKGSNYRIIRRRAIWLIGKWIGVKLSLANRPVLYEACMHLLSGDEDFVVRISAAMTLKGSLDDFEFNSDQFMPYLPKIFELLFNLLKESHECDTKMQVLHVMSFMIEIVGVGIQPHAAPLIQYLPALWEESSDHNMLRCAILTTLVYIVSGLMSESECLHAFLLPIIEMAVDVKEDGHVYLLEDGLQLWLTTIENCHNPTEPLLNLFNNMICLLEISSENLRICLQITNAYIVFYPQMFLAKYGMTLVGSFRYLITDLKSEGLLLVLKCIEMMVRVLPQEATQLLQSLFPTLLKTVLEDKLYPMVLSMYLSLIARLVLYAEQTFTWTVSTVAKDLKITGEEILLKLLTIWSEKMCLVSPEERKKLCALGLAHLCSKNWPPVLQVWGLAITSIGEVIFDITVEDTNEDKLVLNGDETSSEDYDRENEHTQRIQAISRQDPVHTTSLRTYLAQKLKVFESQVGVEAVSTLFETLEEDCKRLLREITSV